jgi:arabinogalactan endo-1,4-beta-galactosidase
MKMSSAFPSTYLKCSDLQERNVKVIMDRVEFEEIGGDQKPVLYFEGKEKGLVLNKTNSNNITAAYGDETDDWQGREIILYPAMTDFQGKTVPCIRVRSPAVKDRAPLPPPKQTENPADFSDDIPF